MEVTDKRLIDTTIGELIPMIEEVVKNVVNNYIGNCEKEDIGDGMAALQEITHKSYSTCQALKKMGAFGSGIIPIPGSRQFLVDKKLAMEEFRKFSKNI